MTDKLPRRTDKRAKAPNSTDQTPPLSDADQKALAAFCKKIKVDEISQTSWETCMSELDVKIPMFLRAAEALAGGEREIKYSRLVRADDSAKPSRESLRISVTIPPQAFDGLEVKQQGHGDRIGERSGDLVVIVRIKTGN